MSRTDLDAATLAAGLRRMAGDPYDSEGGIEWVCEPIQTRVLLDIADLLDENARLRERKVMERRISRSNFVRAIEHERTLKAENAKLREQIHWLKQGDILHVLTDQEYIDQCERERLMQVSIDALDDENTKLRELVRDYERCSVHADCAGCEYDGKLSTHCPLGPCFPDIDELCELGPWKELPHGGVVTESSIRPSEEGSACPVPRASVTFEGQKFTFDAEDSKRFAKLLEGHLRKIAGVEVDE